MTTIDETQVATVDSPAQPAGGITFRHLLRSEWIKMRSLRSTWWSAGIAVAFVVLMSLIMSFNMKSLFSPDAMPDGVAVAAVLSPVQATTLTLILGIDMVAIVLAVLGALSITNEHSSGMIRTTFSAVPSRTPILLAKAIVVFLTAFTISIITLVFGYLAAIPGLSREDVLASLFDSQILQIIALNGVYLAGVAVVALGLGLIIRNGAGSIAAIVALLFILPGILSSLPAQWVKDLVDYFPNFAGSTLVWNSVELPSSLGFDISLYSSGMAAGILAAWVIGMFSLGVFRAKRSDA